jgi:integrase
MARPRKDYRVQLRYRRGDKELWELLALGQRILLKAGNKADAQTEGAERYQQMLTAEKVSRATAGPLQPPLKPVAGTLRTAVTAYMESDKWKSYKPLTQLGMRSTLNMIMQHPAAAPNRYVYGESPLSAWLQPPWGGEAVMRLMAACGSKVHAANKRLTHLDGMFTWLLGKKPEAVLARTKLGIGRGMNPCLGIDKEEPRRDGKRHGHLAFTEDHIETWLHASKDDPEHHRAVRLMQILGPRVSDLHRLNRFMIKTTPAGRVLTFKQTKGADSMYRDGAPPDIVVPMVPELQAIIDEIPLTTRDGQPRSFLIHSTIDQPFMSPRSMSQKVRKWRADVGLPEGLSAHGMRKSATHWWLRNYRDLIGNGFSLKTIFGWVTDKELNRYTKDFNRSAEAEGMLIKLSERRAGRPVSGS